MLQKLLCSFQLHMERAPDGSGMVARLDASQPLPLHDDVRQALAAAEAAVAKDKPAADDGSMRREVTERLLALGRTPAGARKVPLIFGIFFPLLLRSFDRWCCPWWCSCIRACIPCCVVAGGGVPQADGGVGSRPRVCGQHAAILRLRHAEHARRIGRRCELPPILPSPDSVLCHVHSWSRAQARQGIL